MSELEYRGLRWFMSASQVAPDLVAWANGVKQSDAIVALITYDLHAAVEMETGTTTYYLRKNDMKYDTRIVLSYWDPNSITNWSPEIQELDDGFIDLLHVDFVPRGERPRG